MIPTTTRLTKTIPPTTPPTIAPTGALDLLLWDELGPEVDVCPEPEVLPVLDVEDDVGDDVEDGVSVCVDDAGVDQPGGYCVPVEMP